MRKRGRLVTLDDPLGLRPRGDGRNQSVIKEKEKAVGFGHSIDRIKGGKWKWWDT